MVNAAVLLATGVNADGHREVLGVQVTTSETAPAWLTFFQDLRRPRPYGREAGDL